jgi:uncharacterized phage infection (PIP) family protein YhgE
MVFTLIRKLWGGILVKFVEKIFLNDLALLGIIFLGMIILITIFLIVQSWMNRKARENLMRDLVKTQEVIFSNGAEVLAEKLTVYTDNVLLKKIDSVYESLLSQNLLPAVNQAVKTVSDLSETVVKRQEAGMVEIADLLAEMFAAKTREYIKQEADIINSLQDTTEKFSNQLSDISVNIQQLSLRFSNVYEQANAVAATVSEAADLLSSKIEVMGGMFDNTINCFASIQDQVAQNKETVSALSETTAEIKQLADQSALLLSEQNEKTANLFNEAITSMQQSAELSAKAVVSELTMNLSETSQLISNTVEALNENAEKINLAATQFADSLANSYNEFGDNINERLTSVTQAMSESISEQCQNIVNSTETCSNNMVQNIGQLSESLQGHITNLQFITQQLNNNVSSFNENADISASRFEVKMENSISEALNQMDKALADIVDRLVKVTANIQEAADALPRAVKSIKDN